MPFKSEAQRRWIHANKPDMAKKWEKKTPKGKKLPQKVATEASFSDRLDAAFGGEEPPGHDDPEHVFSRERAPGIKVNDADSFIKSLGLKNGETGIKTSISKDTEEDPGATGAWKDPEATGIYEPSDVSNFDEMIQNIDSRINDIESRLTSAGI